LLDIGISMQAGSDDVDACWSVAVGWFAVIG